MMAKKTKKAATPKPERTRSRLAAAPEKRTLQIEKLGEVITWNVPASPYRDNDNLRSAFVGGVEARVQHVNSDSDEGVPIRFAKDTASQRAFEDGYHAAANQDGRKLTARTLAGSTAPAAPVKRARR